MLKNPIKLTPVFLVLIIVSLIVKLSGRNSLSVPQKPRNLQLHRWNVLRTTSVTITYKHIVFIQPSRKQWCTEDTNTGTWCVWLRGYVGGSVQVHIHVSECPLNDTTYATIAPPWPANNTHEDLRRKSTLLHLTYTCHDSQWSVVTRSHGRSSYSVINTVLFSGEFSCFSIKA